MHRRKPAHQERKIVLASSSPRRRELLDLACLRFTVDSGSYVEDMNSGLPPHRLARFLSQQKAREVAHRHPDAIIIAADTFILFRAAVLGKPHTAEEARRMLTRLNGKTHSVITGFTILDTKNQKRVSRSVETRVTFRRLTTAEIDAYVRTKEPLDKAGAYAIQGRGAVLIRKIEGDYFNVVGLPLNTLIECLKGFGISVM